MIKQFLSYLFILFLLLAVPHEASSDTISNELQARRKLIYSSDFEIPDQKIWVVEMDSSNTRIRNLLLKASSDSDLPGRGRGSGT